MRSRCQRDIDMEGQGDPRTDEKLNPRESFGEYEIYSMIEIRALKWRSDVLTDRM